MSDRKSKSNSTPVNSPTNSRTLVGPLECSNFISPNEYSEKTRGLCTFLLRKDMGDISFSDVLNEIFERIRSRQAFDLVAMLQAKRKELQVNGVSIEKCLMLNRWIKHISEHREEFVQLIHEIYTETISQITDNNQQNQMVNYPEYFGQRERDFHRRVDAQKLRRLFYYSSNEFKAPKIIYLQNRTTTLLSYLIDSKMRYDRNSHENYIAELEKVLGTSFMVIAQPHSGVNPVTVVELKQTGIHAGKISVVLISLLHDFMQTHPNIITLDNIDVQLCTTENPNKPDLATNQYELDQTEKLFWKTCELKVDSNNRSQIVHYAELTNITIRQTSPNEKIHFSDKLHYFNFLIKLSVNINEHRISMNYQIPLKSLPFAMVTYNAHIPYALTKVMLDDIRRFTQHQSVDVKHVSDFVRRYFMHRTGVEPTTDLQNYIKQELSRAKDAKMNHQSLEEIYEVFLEQFVTQVEFMAKHPILSMLYADGLFLGPCDSEKSAEALKRLTGNNLPIVGLRFNSIKIDTKSDRTTNSNKTMRATPCFVRVDIYNPRTNCFQNRTFDSSKLVIDIMTFVATALDNRANNIEILSNFNVFDFVKSYENFTKYYDEKLKNFHKEDPKYKPIIDLLYHVDQPNGNSNDYLNRSNLPVNSSVNHLTAHMSDQNNCSPPNQQAYPRYDDEDVVKYVLSKPELCLRILRQCTDQMRASMPSPLQRSPPTTSFAIPNQTTIGNSYPYATIYPENRPQQQLSQMQPISMSTDDLYSDETPLESTNEQNHETIDDFPF